MHVGAMSVLEGAPFFDANGHFRIGEVRDLVLSRLPLLPRFRRRLMTVPYDQGRPIWVDDDRFDITYHVRHTALPKPGSWEQLVALDDARAGEPARPRAAAVGAVVRRRARGRPRRAHPEDAPLAHRRRVGRRRRDAAARRDARLRAAGRRRVDARARAERRRSCCSTRCASARPSRPRSCARSARCCAVRATRSSGPASSARSMGTMVNRESIAPRTSINARTGRHRLLSVVRVPLADVKAIRHGARRHRQRRRARGRRRRAAPAVRRTRGDDADDLRLRVLCPVSVRSDDQRGALGNKISAMFVSLPVGPADPRRPARTRSRRRPPTSRRSGRR